MKLLIKGGRVINPASGFDQVCDIAIAAGRIVAIQNIPADFVPNKTIDAANCIVAPGLMDLAVRLRLHPQLTVIALARDLSLELVAEGVETAEQREMLSDLGCGLYQGYLFGRPVPLESLCVVQ